MPVTGAGELAPTAMVAVAGAALGVTNLSVTRSATFTLPGVA